MKIVIGLVGEIGGGKGTFFTLLKEQLPSYTIARVGFSDIIRETLVLWGLSNTRENLQKLPQAMDQFYGKGSLSHAIQKRVEGKTEDIVVLDGVRWETDLQMIKSFPVNILVYITACPEIRFLRLRSRPQNTGDFNLEWETFLKQEQAPNEILIRQIGARADFEIENNGALDEYRERVKFFFEAFIRERLIEK